MWALLLLACTAGPNDSDSGLRDTSECPTDPTLSWQSWGAGFFLTYCNRCHAQASEERHGAPPGVDFDTRELVQAQIPRIRARVLDQGDMPLGGGVSEDDLYLLERYLCALDAP
jgi:hypothetical protein